MTDTQAPHSPGIWTPPPGTRRVERPRSPRVLGGVCSGLGRFTGIDPVVLRVVVAVLAITGAGVLLYVAAYLAMPEEGDEVSPAESLLGRGQSSANPALAATVGIVGLLAVGWAAFSRGTGVVLTVLAVVGLLLLLRRSGHPMSLPYAHPGAASPGGTPPPGGVAAPAGAASGGAAAQGYATPAYAPQPYAPHGPYGPTTDNAGSYTAPSEIPFAEHTSADPAAGPPPPTTESLWAPAPVGTAAAQPIRRRQSSWLGLAGLGLAVLAVGVLVLLDQLGTVSPSASTFIAVPLTVIGIVVLVSAVAGRAHGLIGLGVLLTIVLVVVQWIGPGNLGRAQLDFGDRAYQPTSAAEVRPSYDLGVGDTHLDLSGVTFIPGVATTLHAGIGDVRITVPADTDVTVVATGGIGNVTAFGHRTSGIGQDARVVSDGADGPGGGELTIHVDGGIGDVTVNRA